MDDNILVFSAPCAMGGEHALCWLCQKSNTLPAFFCQHCGTIQPVRAIDHFARLGVERGIDVDSELLDRQYTNLHRAFSPERFAIRGLGERGHAAGQLAALEESYVTLRDPLRRGRYWLELHQQKTRDADIVNPMIRDLREELDESIAAAECDRIAQKAGQAMEQGIVGLMQALRAQNWSLAGALLAEVNGLEFLLSDVRVRRDKLAANAPLRVGD